MALIRLCLLILSALPFTISDTSKWDGFLTGKGGYKWLPNCEFAGFDIGHKQIEQEKCGQICIATSHTKGCNAFSWQSGWCNLKQIPAHSLSRKPTTGASCGVLPWEFENEEIFEDVADLAGIKWETNGDPWDSGHVEELIEDITVQAKQMKCAYIKNLAFNEYLFAADHTYDENSRPVFTWRSKKGHPRDWSSTQGVWILEGGSQENAYSIKNAYRQELLFASDCRFAQYERQVFTWRNPTRYDHGHLHWQLEDAMDNTFYIKNRMFDEYLYAIEDALSFDPVRRQVHTWTQSRDVSAWAGVGNWVVETTTCPK